MKKMITMTMNILAMPWSLFSLLLALAFLSGEFLSSKQNSQQTLVKRYMDYAHFSPDDPECEAVEDDKEEEGDESHHDKVGDEQVVSAVAVAVPQNCGAHLRRKD